MTTQLLQLVYTFVTRGGGGIRHGAGASARGTTSTRRCSGQSGADGAAPGLSATFIGMLCLMAVFLYCYLPALTNDYASADDYYDFLQVPHSEGT